MIFCTTACAVMAYITHYAHICPYTTIQPPMNAMIPAWCNPPCPSLCPLFSGMRLFNYLPVFRMLGQSCCSLMDLILMDNVRYMPYGSWSQTDLILMDEIQCDHMEVPWHPDGPNPDGRRPACCFVKCNHNPMQPDGLNPEV